MSTGYHTRWVIPAEHRESPAYIAAGKRLAFGQAVYACRTALGLSEADLAAHVGLDADEIEAIETGGTEPTLDLIERLATAMGAAATVDPADTDHPIRFEARAA